MNSDFKTALIILSYAAISLGVVTDSIARVIAGVGMLLICALNSGAGEK